MNREEPDRVPIYFTTTHIQQVIAGAYNIQPGTSIEKIVKRFEWTKKYGDDSIQDCGRS